MAEFSKALAESGYETNLFFIGDPDLPGVEKTDGGRLTYHRWCQWISRYHPKNVYDGEERKLFDYERSLPGWIAGNIFPATGSQLVVLAEEWHTAGSVIHLHRLAQKFSHLNIIFVWNANNVFGFNRIRWDLLKKSAAITTVSRYMKHLMQPLNLQPLVIPNGIPKRWFEPVEQEASKALRNACGGKIVLAKIGRFDPGKRWLSAIRSIAQLKALGHQPKLLMRGGLEPHGDQVRAEAQQLGLKTSRIRLTKNASLAQILQALKTLPDSDIYDLQFFISEEILRLFYHAADAVLANSGHEPFGLVGLEVMACQGVAVTGSTGEDYAQSFQNALVVDTGDPWELTSNLVSLISDPALALRLRKTGHQTAQSFLWSHVMDELMRKLAYIQRKETFA